MDSSRTIHALSAALAKAGAGAGGHGGIRVFIGDTELRDIIRVEVDDGQAHAATMGRMRRR
jgi:hypothetical protein